jgi:prephenate dehydrogenase
MKWKWDTVAIVGVGLLGGSIGLALQQRGLARNVVGIGRRSSSLQRARQAETITQSTTDLERGVADAELIVVCTPVSDIVARVQQVTKHCPDGALITDVGSTKAVIVETLEASLTRDISFVGSHPLAGSEKTGPEHAVPDLFHDRVTVVTPTAQTPRSSTETILEFWSLLGSQVLEMSPLEHDRVLAMTSHTTHVVASALAAATAASELPLTASGWQDTTRVAAGDAQLWQQILLTNREPVLQSLQRFERVLAEFRAALERQDEKRIVELLEAGKQIRDTVGS